MSEGGEKMENRGKEGKMGGGPRGNMEKGLLWE